MNICKNKTYQRTTKKQDVLPQSWLNALYLLLQSCCAAAFFFRCPAASALAFDMSDRSRPVFSDFFGADDGLAGGAEVFVSGRGIGTTSTSYESEINKRKIEIISTIFLENRSGNVDVHK